MENIGSAKVIRKKTELWVPHNYNKEIADFVYPAVGPDNYQNVGNEILENKQFLSTGDYIASLIHSAYYSNAVNEPEFQNIRNILKDSRIWVFNRNLWTDEGVYVIQDSEAIGTSQSLNQDYLENLLNGGKEISGIRFSQGRKVRFAPKESYEFGEHEYEDFAKDGFVIASFGIEGAKKLGEVSSKFIFKPITMGIETNTPEQMISFLGGSSILNFRGDNLGDYKNVYGFGLLNNY
ncbi:MAG: hypothetical protein Q7S33_00110 [Nanoarchaeota archaeon]|nr:hypothetical protein [Nanoarchaeota archaeon]